MKELNIENVTMEQEYNTWLTGLIMYSERVFGINQDVIFGSVNPRTFYESGFRPAEVSHVIAKKLKIST